METVLSYVSEESLSGGDTLYHVVRYGHGLYAGREADCLKASEYLNKILNWWDGPMSNGTARDFIRVAVH